MRPTLPKSVLAQTQLCQQQRTQVLLWVLMLLSFIYVAVYANNLLMVPGNIPVEFSYVALILGLPFSVVLALKVRRYLNSRSCLREYENIGSGLENACVDSSALSIQGVLTEATALAKTNHLIFQLLDHYKPVLHDRMTESHRQSLMQELEQEHAQLEVSCKSKVQEKIQQVPLIKAKNDIATSSGFLAKRRKEMAQQWDAAYERFSWWNKLKYCEGPDFKDIDKAINELSTLQRKLVARHSDDLQALEAHFKESENRALSRIAASKVEAARYIRNSDYHNSLESPLVQKALWFSAMSVPLSMWSDVDSAADVYDSLRAVNSNYSSMSDLEIWWEALFLPAESLAGLAALTKGAYFERLVAEDTGGELFEHFNNPETDIVIDGIAFQLKATDSAGYVYSVDETIPVIATTEVALATGVVDSGYSHEDLTNTIDNALGGTIVDIGDTTVDAVLAGLGGLGLFATIEGINHASKKYENGGDGVESLFEGAGVAIEGTARALVGAAEMGYNVLASRPSRFVGRALLNGLKELDDKMMQAGSKK